MGSFYEKELQKTDQKEFRIEKVIKKKGDKLYVKWKGYHNSFNSWIDKKDITQEDATKEDLKNITHVDTKFFALKTNLSALKTEVDKLDIPKLCTIPTYVTKLSC